MIERFQTFTTDISCIYKNIQYIKKCEMQKIGLKSNHTLCLNFLRETSGGLTAAELCSAAKMDKSGISRTLSDLEKMGLIKYLHSEDTEDKRRYRAKAVLTEKGLIYADKVTALVVNAVGIGGQGLSRECRENFYAALSVISRNLEKFCLELESEEKK